MDSTKEENEEYKKLVEKNMKLMIKELKQRQICDNGLPLTGYERYEKTPVDVHKEIMEMF